MYLFAFCCHGFSVYRIKIYNIFNSPNYIYKVDVTIVTDSGTFNKRIVGKTKTNLITMENEYIPIDTIRDIYITG